MGWEANDSLAYIMEEGLSKLEVMTQDELIKITDQKIVVLEAGRPFIRNVCMAFDFHLHEQANNKIVYSQTI